MSYFIPSVNAHWRASLRREPWRDDVKNKYEWANCTRPESWMWLKYALWPGSRMMSGDLSVGMGGCGDAATCSGWFEMPKSWSGGNQGALFICGVTRDSSGAALGICTVQVFRASDDLYLGECTSGPTGEYCASSWYASTNHYLVAYKAGAPDVAGTTVNTIQPTTTRTY